MLISCLHARLHVEVEKGFAVRLHRSPAAARAAVLDEVRPHGRDVQRGHRVILTGTWTSLCTLFSIQNNKINLDVIAAVSRYT